MFISSKVNDFQLKGFSFSKTLFRYINYDYKEFSNYRFARIWSVPLHISLYTQHIYIYFFKDIL